MGASSGGQLLGATLGLGAGMEKELASPRRGKVVRWDVAGGGCSGLEGQGCHRGDSSHTSHGGHTSHALQVTAGRRT